LRFKATIRVGMIQLLTSFVHQAISIRMGKALGIGCLLMLANYNCHAQDDIYVRPAAPVKVPDNKPTVKEPYDESFNPSRIINEKDWHISITAKMGFLRSVYSYDKTAFPLSSDFKPVNSVNAQIGLLVENANLWGIEAGIGVLDLNSTFSYTNLGISSRPDTNTKLSFNAHYFSLYANGRYNVIQDADNSISLQLLAGGEINVLQNATFSINRTAGSNSASGSGSYDKYYNNTLLNLVVGGSARIRLVNELYLSFHAMGHIGLTYLGDDLLQVQTPSGTSLKVPISVQAISLGAGLVYRLK